jgi:hypothetical protein
MERVNEVRRHIIECIKNTRHGIRVSRNSRSMDLEWKRFERALAERLRKSLRGICDDVEVSAEWLWPECVSIDVLCKSDRGEVEYYVEVPIMIKMNADSLSEKDVEIIQ